MEQVKSYIEELNWDTTRMKLRRSGTDESRVLPKWLNSLEMKDEERM